jgi:hypothetical protein
MMKLKTVVALMLLTDPLCAANQSAVTTPSGSTNGSLVATHIPVANGPSGLVDFGAFTFLNFTNPSYGGKGDAIQGVVDCVFTVSSTLVTCPNETFAPTDVGKLFFADDIGTSYAPLVTTISSWVDVHDFHIAVSAQAPALNRIASYTVSVQGSGYTFGSTQTLVGGTAQVVGTGTPAVLDVVSASIAAGGSGASGTTCTMTGTTGTALSGKFFTATAPISGGAVVNPVTVTFGSYYTAGMADTTHEPVTSNCGVAGAQLAVLMGAPFEYRTTGTGLYTTLPCSGVSAAATTSSDGGTGLTLLCNSNQTTATWGADNKPALQAVIAASNLASAAGKPVAIYIPAGNYLTSPVNTTVNGYGCWIGDGHNLSNVFTVPNTAGDTFSWLDSNRGPSLQFLGGTQIFSDATKKNQAGGCFRGISVIGDRNSTVRQNALMFYGKTEFFLAHDFYVGYMRGNAIGFGADSTGYGGILESKFDNGTFLLDGDSGIPTIDLGSVGHGDGVNNDDLADVRVFDSFGAGIAFRGCSSLNGARAFRMWGNVYVEGSSVSKTGLALFERVIPDQHRRFCIRN